MTRDELKRAGFYAPTMGEHVQHWNVFPVKGRSLFDVPYSDLPEPVQRFLREWKQR